MGNSELSSQKQNNEEYIYKFFKWKHLQLILTHKRLRLNRTESWERVVEKDGDVYENCVFNSLYKPDSTLKKSNVYGQSWTFNQSSDAMWRIYSKMPLEGLSINNLQDTAIKVKTTIPKLKEVINKPISDIECEKYAYMGKVKYLGPKSFKKWLNEPEKDHLIKSLFVKRWAYAHENEYRIIVCVDNNDAESYEHIEFDIDTDYIFDRFFLDPRLTSDQQEEFTDYLVNSLNISKDKIDKSSLYTFKNKLTKDLHLKWNRPNMPVTMIEWDK